MRWPWPGDSREEKARRVAIFYRELAARYAPPEVLAEVDAKWRGLQQDWLFPTLQPLRLDDWLPASEVAALIHVPANIIRMWGVRKHIRVTRVGALNHYNVGDVVEYEARQRARRASRELK